MVLDILCPGDWQDSYESRSLGEGSWQMPVNNFHDVMRVVKTYFDSKNGKHEQELFNTFSLYLDGELFGSYSKGEITIFPPTCDMKVRNGVLSYRYKFGKIGYIISLRALEIGINSRTVRVDDKHKW